LRNEGDRDVAKIRRFVARVVKGRYFVGLAMMSMPWMGTPPRDFFTSSTKSALEWNSTVQGPFVERKGEVAGFVLP